MLLGQVCSTPPLEHDALLWEIKHCAGKGPAPAQHARAAGRRPTPAHARAAANLRSAPAHNGKPQTCSSQAAAQAKMSKYVYYYNECCINTRRSIIHELIHPLKYFEKRHVTARHVAAMTPKFHTQVTARPIYSSKLLIHSRQINCMQ